MTDTKLTLEEIIITVEDMTKVVSKILVLQIIERCAKVCDAYVGPHGNAIDAESAAEELAKRIRALKEKVK